MGEDAVGTALSGAQHVDKAFACPFELSDYLLSVTRDAYINKDFPRWVERFALPMRIETFSGERCVSSPEDLRQLWDAMQNHFANFGVMDLKRNTVAARFVSETEMECTFVSQHVLRSLQLSDQIIVHSTNQLMDGMWRISNSRYATNFEAVSNALMKGG